MSWRMMIAVVGTTVLVGCSDGKGADVGAAAGREGGRALLAQYGINEREVLRVRADLKRGRLWVLGLENVYVYEFATRRLARKIELPDWSVARYVCEPDLAIDSTGTAWVSSNSQARLWRIAGGDLSVSEHSIRLQGKEQLDVGFGALAFGPDGALFAMTATAGGMLWEIDPRGGGASLVEIGSPAEGRCDFTDLFAAVAAAR